jgi:pyruvate dehydrogenase kinase 2/3/4
VPVSTPLKLACLPAHRIRDFQALPFIVGANKRVETVYGLYLAAFDKLTQHKEIKTLEENKAFCETLRSLLDSHLVVIPQLAMGMMECNAHIPVSEMDKFMNNLLRTRISRRVLAEQHIQLSEDFASRSFDNGNSKEHRIGIINTRCKAIDIVKKCAALSQEMTKQRHGISASVEVDGHVDTEFVYIPDHIEYIVFELLKNSMRFQVQNWQAHSGNTDHGEKPPPIVVTIVSSEGVQSAADSVAGAGHVASNPSSIIFRVSDQGGGFDRTIYSPHEPEHLWSFAHNVLHRSILRGDGLPLKRSERRPPNVLPLGTKKFAGHSASESGLQATNDSLKEPVPLLNPNFVHIQPKMAAKLSDPSLSPAVHLGIGLQMARVFADYWGGGLELHTMYGYGSDAYVRISGSGEVEESLTIEERGMQ